MQKKKSAGWQLALVADGPDFRALTEDISLETPLSFYKFGKLEDSFDSIPEGFLEQPTFTDEGELVERCGITEARVITHLIAITYRQLSPDHLPGPLVGVSNDLIMRLMADCRSRRLDLRQLLEASPRERRLKRTKLTTPLRLSIELRAEIISDPYAESLMSNPGNRNSWQGFDGIICDLVWRIGNDPERRTQLLPHIHRHDELAAAKKEWASQFRYVCENIGEALERASDEIINEGTSLTDQPMDSAEDVIMALLKSMMEPSNHTLPGVHHGTLYRYASPFHAKVTHHADFILKRMKGRTALNVGHPAKKLRYTAAEMAKLGDTYRERLRVWQKARREQLRHAGGDWHTAVVEAVPELTRGPALAFTELDPDRRTSMLKQFNKRYLDWLGEKSGSAKVYKWKPMHLAYTEAAEIVSIRDRGDLLFSSFDISRWRMIKRELDAFEREQREREALASNADQRWEQRKGKAPDLEQSSNGDKKR